MEAILIKISALWICTALIFLLGDVLRLYKGDVVVGEIEGKKATQGMFMFIAVMMMTPILMVFLNLVLPADINKIANIVVAGFFFLMNLLSIGSYKGHYDKFLLAVSMIFNLLIIGYSLNLIS